MRRIHLKLFIIVLVSGGLFLILARLSFFGLVQNQRTETPQQPYPTTVPQKQNRHQKYGISISRDSYINGSQYRSNGVVGEPILFTLSPYSTTGSMLYYPTGCMIQNPTLCPGAATDCPVAIVEECAAFPMVEQLPPFTPKKISYDTANIQAGEYRLAFYYLTSERYATQSGYLFPSSSEEFVRDASVAYSDVFTVIPAPFTREETLSICQYWETASIQSTVGLASSVCRKTYEREFSTPDHPIPVSKLAERQEALLDDLVTIETKVYLGDPDDSNRSSFKIHARVDDARMFGSQYTTLILYKDAEAVSCIADRNFIPECKGWVHGATYYITGRLRKGIIAKGSAETYYFDVKQAVRQEMK